MTRSAEQPDKAYRTRVWLIVLIGVLATLGVLGAVFVYVSTTSRAFVFSEGYYSSSDEPTVWSRRKCIGVPYRPELYGGWDTYCVGVPYGEWECFETYPDGGPTLRRPCR